jgi:hypothetical protein
VNWDSIFEVFICWQTAVLCLGVFLITFAIRRPIEVGWTGAKKNKWWNEVALPLAPIVIGALLGALSKKFPWPTPVSGSGWARAMYGATCGLSCGWVYTRFRSIIKTWSGGGSTPAPKPADAAKTDEEITKTDSVAPATIPSPPPPPPDDNDNTP